MSTHKTLFGPQGGLVLAFEKNAEAIKKATFPGLTSSHHIHHMAAKAVTFAEALEFGKDYASQTIKNAKALAVALNDLGFEVLGEKKGFTQSHQVVVNVLGYGDGGKIEADLEKANIIVNRQLIPGDLKAKRHYMHPGGIRLGTSEVTRLGMKESEMKEIASFIKKVIIQNFAQDAVKGRVVEFRKNYQKTQYCFDNKLGAYEYVKLR
jgi:glycine hydroxymethyltransferase